MSSKETQEKLIANMRNWQRIEDAAITSAGAVKDKSKNPIIKLVMEIIQRDSEMHRRVQELVVDSLTTETVAISPDELVEVWDLIEQHIAMEEKVGELAEMSLAITEGTKGMLAQRYLLKYLMADEEKHDKLLDDLALIKKGMQP